MRKFLTIADISHKLSTLPQDTQTDIYEVSIEYDVDSTIWIRMECEANINAKAVFILPLLDET